MSEKLRNYQVLDVLNGGTFYKVRHKVTNNIFAWKAYDCRAFSEEQIQSTVNDVKTISKLLSKNLLRYYDTILHAPSKTLYFVLDYNEWQSARDLIAVCRATDKYIAESFIWYLLLELARVCKAIEYLNFAVVRKCITLSSIYVDKSGKLCVNCFELMSFVMGAMEPSDLMRQVGNVIHALCYRVWDFDSNASDIHYSDDLQDIVTYLTDDKNSKLPPDVILYHPTVLANVETHTALKNLSEILISPSYTKLSSEVNKCDSEKAVELCRTVKPAPRRLIANVESPIYANISPKRSQHKQILQCNSNRGSLSPTIAALALELPGFVPRSRKPVSGALERYNNPQQVSQDTFSHHWMSRLIALRQREESLNKRERELIAKEIINSPATKIIQLSESCDLTQSNADINGITLPPEIQVAHEETKESRREWESQRRHRRSGSVRARGRRKSYAYEDLDSSLSADPGDESFIITAKKFTKENMPRRNIFPDLSTKKVHFTSSNPFVESDESVTLTFYELENVDNEGYQVPRQEEKSLKDISKFKYLNVEKVASEKRAAMPQYNSSPSKQAKTSDKSFNDITNTSYGNMRKTPSKTSLTSRGSVASRYSATSAMIYRDMEAASKVSDNTVAAHTRTRTRAATRQSLAPTLSTPREEKKPKSRKSLLPFKTPFRFKSSSKV